jgi:ABC-type Zn2+ transport system substrate-binding protein/surface adhesin
LFFFLGVSESVTEVLFSQVKEKKREHHLDDDDDQHHQHHHRRHHRHHHHHLSLQSDRFFNNLSIPDSTVQDGIYYRNELMKEESVEKDDV